MSADKVYTWLEIAEHVTEESCWIVQEGKVFDVTEYLETHPGTKFPLLKYAGEECYEQFVRCNHSEEARKLRDTFQIGVVEANPPTAEYWLAVRHAKWERLRFTPEQVAQHNKQGDQWVMMDGYVYDLSTLQHPGGQEVIDKFAGKDATQKFHAVEKHLPNAIENRQKYRIGNVNAPQQKKSGCINCKWAIIGAAGVLGALIAGTVIYKKTRK
ncbi:Cytochrome b5-like heme/steroid binding domain [Pseudocohnilembus persalinus]|uniref:Cytochrome b5-like heme/steroid binding domain n=1 Tax=Pseudocohnilembus persalinus TaxID=266149 RepID=A0A0V0QPT0_PSEPJ|nr:Cytochrome b5-like heme/steroid binding domain [Pseudocohnilembus persalinus]|eukprot:KRX04196.1 Cytochrome b5-like heme/steroid binding domain [Pseudocohnilembus persalinus]